MLPLAHDPLVALTLLVLAAPLLAILLAGLATLLQRPGAARERLMGWGTRLLSGASLLCSLLVVMGPPGEFPLVFDFAGIDFYLDALSVYFILLVNLVAFFASWYTVDYLQFDARRAQHHQPAAFHALFNGFHFTMLLVPMVDNLVILWMAIELTTLVSTLLVRYRRQRRTLEAAWKYIGITTAGIVFALFGTILLTDAIDAQKTCPTIAGLVGQGGTSCADLTGSDLMRWSLLARQEIATTLNPEIVTLAFLFILVGYGTKAGLAPMHTWLPDGHGEAPSPVSALLSGVLLKSALYAVLRFYVITNLSRGSTEFTSNILLISGLLSLALATPFILKRNKFKRVLAYHSLEHMGIIVFGLGIGGPVALLGALLHTLNHALTKALMFLSYGNVRREYVGQAGGEMDDEELGGVLRGTPVSGAVLLLGGLGLVGSPPFNIFMSEFIILWAAFGRIVHPGSEGGTGIYVGAVALFLLTVTLIFGGLVGHLSRLLLGQPNPPSTGARDRLGQLLPLLLLLIIILIFGVWIPTVPVDFPQLLAKSVCILQHGAGEACAP